MKSQLLTIVSLLFLFFPFLTNTSVSSINCDVPEDFPQYGVPSFEKEMDSLRILFWNHFIPYGQEWDDWLNGKDLFPNYPALPSGPKATLWDEWLCGPMLWPAIETGGISDRMRESWDKSLSTRIIDEEGYVETKQGTYYSHNLGWPFPAWYHGKGYGWHFSFKNSPGELETPNGLAYRPPKTCTQEGWQTSAVSDCGIEDGTWNLLLTGNYASITTPEQPIDSFQSPFLQIRWFSAGARFLKPYVEWTTADKQDFNNDRRFYFEPPLTNTISSSMIPVYRHPEWKGEIRKIRICFGNSQKDIPVSIQAFFTQYDTRHNINNMLFVSGCADYFLWTGNLDFLRRNINRIRKSLQFCITEHHVEKEKVITTTWVGHDGISSVIPGKDGKYTYRFGHGIPNNWWDIIPFGYKDTYATIHFYDALNKMAIIEEGIKNHPEWNIPGGAYTLDPLKLRELSRNVKKTGNKIFWNDKTGRFASGIDIEGKSHDYGNTSLNLEAIHYGFAFPEHAKTIMQWIGGERIVGSDTSKGDDIYHWIFAPRTTTLRNPDYWYWGWGQPASVPFGAQIQDGGACLGYSFYDLMARLKVNGADDSWKRLKTIADWFGQIRKAGGYRNYYANKEGSLQGGNVGGGLGIDLEFFESLMVTQVILKGFMGFSPTCEGFSVKPALPSSWPELSIDRIRIKDLIVKITAKRDTITVYPVGTTDRLWVISVPESGWTCELTKNGSAAQVNSKNTDKKSTSCAFSLDMNDTEKIVILKKR